MVVLRGEPADSFGFVSLAKWPYHGDNYDNAVLDGILDELYATGLGKVVAKVEFTLEAIEWHEVDSSAFAFYHAARGAVKEILGSGQSHDNIAWPWKKR